MKPKFNVKDNLFKYDENKLNLNVKNQFSAYITVAKTSVYKLLSRFFLWLYSWVSGIIRIARSRQGRTIWYTRKHLINTQLATRLLRL